MKVLVKEKIADAGVELLRESFDVELGLDWDDAELAKRIGEFDGILIRSATKLDSDLIEKGERLRVIGRAGTGSSPGRRPRIRIVMPPSSTKICAAPRAIVSAAASLTARPSLTKPNASSAMASA